MGTSGVLARFRQVLVDDKMRREQMLKSLHVERAMLDESEKEKVAAFDAAIFVRRTALDEATERLKIMDRKKTKF